MVPTAVSALGSFPSFLGLTLQEWVEGYAIGPPFIVDPRNVVDSSVCSDFSIARRKWCLLSCLLVEPECGIVLILITQLITFIYVSVL